MITLNNYQSEIAKVDFDNLAPALRNTHEKLMTRNPEQFYGKNENITRVIDTYLEKLNEATAAKPEAKSDPPPKTKTPKPKATTKPNDTTPANKPGNAKGSSKSSKTKRTRKPVAKAKSKQQKPSPEARQAKAKTDPAIKRTVKSPELEVLTNLKNLPNKTKAFPKGEKRVASIQRLISKIYNYALKDLFPKHNVLILEQATKIERAIDKMPPEEKIKINLHDKTVQAINDALKDKQKVMEVTYLAGPAKK